MQTVLLLLISIIIAIYLNSLFQTNMAALRALKATNSEFSMLGKTAVVVGGTSGIGFGLAKRFAVAGATVTIVGRSERGIVQQLSSLSPDGTVPTHSFVPVNAYLLSGVQTAIDTITSTHDKVDYLVQSQGMATIQGFTPSAEEGLDQKLTLHVYSRASFARGLQPLLALSEDPRVLSVLSAGIHSPYTNYKTDPELSLGGYSIKNAADSAGFYNDILADGFSKQFPGTTFMHAAPGFVSTRWGTEMPAPIRWCVRALQVFGKSKEDCAEYMFKGLTQSKSGGFVLLNEYGIQINKVTSLHEEAKEYVFNHIMQIIDGGKAVAQPVSKQ